MRRSALIGVALAASVSLGACATDGRYTDNRQLNRAATGAAIGAAAGAGVGAVVHGIDPLEGAAAGAAVGAVAGALTADRNWYRDTRGYCYYVNDRGERIYDYDKRC
jgi:uncharacterized membrane protein